MPTHYLYGTILTAEAVAANNRGDNLGNTTTLQKVFLGDDLHTSVSAESIRFAIRYRFQLQGLKVNRTYETAPSETKKPYRLDYKDEKRTGWTLADKAPYIDDDLMGFMDAEAAKKEQEEEPVAEGQSGAPPAPAGETKGPRKPKPLGRVDKRQSPLAVGRAVSLRPYRGELSYNCVSGVKTKDALSLYSAEMHTTEYQYSFGLNLGDVVSKPNIAHLIDAIVDMPPVAGNHARFSYDFSPATVIFRLTACHSPKIQNCFDHDEETRTFSLARLLSRVKSGDVPPGELVVGGLIAGTVWGTELLEAGANVLDGVLKAATEVKRRIVKLGGPYAVVDGKGGRS
jgi:CRISPR-associated protein Cst2